MVFKQLICFNGKALNPGTITKLFEAAKKIDVSALSLPANASPKKVAEYFCNVEKAVDKVIVGTRVWQEMGIGLGSADALPLNKLVMSMLYSRCDKETLQRSLNELSTDNGFKVVKACDNISDDEYPRSVGIQVARQEAPLTKAVQNIAKSFSAPATYRQSIFETLASSLDVEIPDEPDFNTLNLTDDEFAGIYQTFKQHTIEDHPEMIEKERNASPITYTNLD
jgi:hypothetical protein